jgi:hypothetical protein
MQVNIHLAPHPRPSQLTRIQNTDVYWFSPARIDRRTSPKRHAAPKLHNVESWFPGQVKRLNHPTARELVVWIKKHEPWGLGCFDQSNSRIEYSAVHFSFNQSKPGMAALVRSDHFHTAVATPIVVTQDADSRGVDREVEDRAQRKIEVVVFVEDRKQDGHFTRGGAGRERRPVSKDEWEVVKLEGGELKEPNARRRENPMRLSSTRQCHA